MSLKKYLPPFRSWHTQASCPSPGSPEQCLISLHGDRGILTPSHSLEGKHFITGLLAGKVKLTWTASLLEFSI